MRWLGSLVLALALVSGAPARAEPLAEHGRAASTARPISLDEAIELALRSAPELGIPQAAQRAVKGVERAARIPLPHPPRVEIGAGPRFREADGRGLEATMGVTQDIALSGYGSARRALARKLGAWASANLASVQSSVAKSAALAWIDLRLAFELERIRQRAELDAQELLRIAAARVRSGRSAPTEEAFARSVLGSARAAVLDAEGLRVTAEAELRYWTGVPRDLAIEPSGDLDEPHFSAVPAVRSSEAPTVLEARARADIERASESVVRSTGAPVVSLGPLVTHEGTGDWIVQMRVGVPIPLFNPAAFDAATRRIETERARAEAVRTQAAFERDRLVAVHEREHARQARDVLRALAIEPARESVRQALLQYQAGSTDLVSVLAMRRELSGAEERWAEAAANVRRADVRLLALMGFRREPARRAP